MMIIFAVSANAQQKIAWTPWSGHNCLLTQVGYSATFDKNPLNGDAKMGSGVDLKMIYFRKGISYIANGRYEKGRSALLAGVGINFLNNKKVTPSLEVTAGMGEQLLGFAYQADISGDVNGSLKQVSYYKKFKFQAEAALNIEIKLADRWSLVCSGGLIYRSAEGSKADVNSNIDINGSDVSESLQALSFKSSKFAPKASLGIRFRIK